jgi:deazaflavin-dependent oxidoreductase (nitroreductase family)
MKLWPLHTDAELRAMYQGNRGNETARKYARFWAAAFSLGVMPRRWITLEVVGRTTGRPTRFPLGMATQGGKSYLVSMLGSDCNWVKNVRAANGEVVIRRRRARACQLVEVDVSRRAPLIKLYLEQVPGARPHIRIDRKAEVGEFESIAASTPVFQVLGKGEIASSE